MRRLIISGEEEGGGREGELATGAVSVTVNNVGICFKRETVFPAAGSR